MEIRKVGVVGLGTMGAGIAQVSVQSGFDTVGREVSEELGQRGRGTIERYLDRAVAKERISEDERDAALGRLTLTTDLPELADCDLVIEAALEELDLKRKIFAELDRVTRPDAVLATNTSAVRLRDRRSHRTTGACRRHAFLQPRARPATRGDRACPRQLRRSRRRSLRVGRASR
jgi:3-hydroxybutyryl-CoA dehydrogenase